MVLEKWDGEGNGTPLQYSCLENPMDGGAWWAAVHAKGRTRLSNFTFTVHFHGEGNGNPLQCSCLENPRDCGAWWAAIYGVAQSRTRLKQLSSSSSISQVINVFGVYGCFFYSNQCTCINKPSLIYKDIWIKYDCFYFHFI